MFNADGLTIRPVHPENINDVYNLMSNEQVAKYALWHRHSNIGETMDFIHQALVNFNNRKEFVIHDTHTGEFVGMCNLKLYEYNDSGLYYATIGYYTLPEHWGKGYATKIAMLLIDTAFTYFNIQKVIATCDPNNQRSENVMKRCGMTYEGYSRADKLRHDGTFRDSLIYSILPHEFTP